MTDQSILSVSRTFLPKLVVAGGVLVSCAVAYYHYTQETRQILDKIESETQGIAITIEDRINALSAPGTGMAAFVSATLEHRKTIGRDQFQTWATARRQSLSVVPRIYYWRPLVKEADREIFESAMRTTGDHSSYSILDKAPDGTLVPAARREFYLPLVFLVSEGTPGRAAFGLDGLQEPMRSDALRRARETGLPQLSLPYHVYAFSEAQNPGVFFACPVFAGGDIPPSVDERRRNLLGIVGIIYSLSEALNHAMGGGTGAGAGLEIFVRTTPFAADGTDAFVAHYDPHNGSFVTASTRTQTGPLDGWSVARAIRLGGATWHLLFHASSRTMQAMRTWEPWLFLVIGLLLTGGAGGGVLSVCRRSEFLSLEIASSHTQLAATENELAAANIRFSTLISASPAAIVCLDSRGRVILWNPAAEHLFGYTASDVLGHPTPVAPETSSGGSVDGMGTCRTKDGRALTVAFTSAPLPDVDGQPSGSIYVIADQTDRVSLENQLFQAQKMEAVGQLTGGVAHDFNNLLGIIIGNIDLMEGEVSETGEELRQEALNSALRGADLTRALLAFSRRQELNPTTVDVGQLLDSLIKLLRRTLGEAIDMQLECESGMWPVHIDAHLLETGITNLAINARDAMPDGGTLYVRAGNAVLDDDYVEHNPEALPGEYAMIEIADTGHGMPPDVLARAFEPFFTTKEKDKGTGLGLPMVYGFVKQSGGHIKIYSEASHGTAVRMYFPRYREAGIEGVDQAGERRADGTAMGGSETILVVEDNANLRRTVVLQLDSLGYRTIEAENGLEAMEKINDVIDLDLMFSDVVMPGGMTGFDLAREARNRRPGLKILLTSGFPGTMSEKERLIAPGFRAEILGKPFRKEQLARKVREILDHG